MKTTKKQKIEEIKNILSRQDFADFYGDGGAFDDWIRGEASTEEGKKEEERKVNQGIERFFAKLLND